MLRCSSELPGPSHVHCHNAWNQPAAHLSLLLRVIAQSICCARYAPCHGKVLRACMGRTGVARLTCLHVTLPSCLQSRACKLHGVPWFTWG